MLPKLLFLSFLVGSLTSSSRTISKSFLLLRIDFVDDDDDEEEEEEDKPSSSESSDAKKNEKQQQTKRSRRRESTRSRENNTLFQSFRCDSSACNLYVLFEFFSLQRFSLSLKKFRVYNPILLVERSGFGTFSAHEALDFLRSVLSSVRRLHIFFD